MAKKFLEAIGEAFGDDALAEVIPMRKNSNTKPNPPAKSPPKRSRSKKGFLDKIDRQMQSSKPVRATRKGRKSFLDTIEEALDSNAFDDLIPSRRPSQKERLNSEQLERRFSTMITTEVLERAQEIAKQKGIRLKDVIQVALKLYIDQEGK